MCIWRHDWVFCHYQKKIVLFFYHSLNFRLPPRFFFSIAILNVLPTSLNPQMTSQLSFLSFSPGTKIENDGTKRPEIRLEKLLWYFYTLLGQLIEFVPAITAVVNIFRLRLFFCRLTILTHSVARKILNGWSQNDDCIWIVEYSQRDATNRRPSQRHNREIEALRDHVTLFTSDRWTAKGRRGRGRRQRACLVRLCDFRRDGWFVGCSAYGKKFFF